MQTEKEFKYDVAISFLSKDQGIASEIHRRLFEGLKVFFYPRSQEELAGTNGLESMRTPFRDESRLVVVLYREGWGHTPWTGVEETAITDGCLAHGWKRLLFIVLDPSSVLPPWLPDARIRFDFEKYGIEQAAGAIKMRVEQNGGQFAPLTALKAAELLKLDEEYQCDKAEMKFSSEAMQKIGFNVHELFQRIGTKCGEIEARGLANIKCDASDVTCVITNLKASMQVSYQQRYANTLEDSALIIKEYRGQLMLPSERGSHYYVTEPQKLKETKYFPELSRSRELGWSRNGANGFISSSDLAEQCVINFMELARKVIRQP
jgi:hypothetical protein